MTRLLCPFCDCCIRYGCDFDGDPPDCDMTDPDQLCPCTRQGGDPE